MSAKVKTMVDAKIAGKKVMVFSKSYCPYCTKAKKALKNHKLGDDIEYMEIENDPDCDAIQSYLKKLTGASSVPRVFINGKCIGGGSEAEAMDKSGQLAKLLG